MMLQPHDAHALRHLQAKFGPSTTPDEALEVAIREEQLADDLARSGSRNLAKAARDASHWYLTIAELMERA